MCAQINKLKIQLLKLDHFKFLHYLRKEIFTRLLYTE